MRTQDIYKNFTKGKVFSDKDLDMAIDHYTKLFELLVVSGQEFTFTTNEVCTVLNRLTDYRNARKQK